MYLIGPQTKTNETCCFDDVCCEPRSGRAIPQPSLQPDENGDGLIGVVDLQGQRQLRQ